jgi:hypothetical protein
MPALEIIVDVRDDQTMSQYKTPKNGKIKFHNADTTYVLEIKAKQDAPWPFCNKDHVTPRQPFKVDPGTAKAAWICNTVESGELLYSAQIGTAKEEDPIIIFEKTKKLVFDPVLAVALGVAIGVAATLLYLRVRNRRQRRPA